jgi:hypothetical protein
MGETSSIRVANNYLQFHWLCVVCIYIYERDLHIACIHSVHNMPLVLSNQ